MRSIKIVRICALLNLGAIGTIFACSLAEIQDPSVVESPPAWFLFLFLIALPYGAIIWLRETGWLKAGLFLATTWGITASFSLVPWIVVPNFHIHYTSPVWCLLLLSLLTLPVQIVMANSSKALSAAVPEAAFKSWYMRLLIVFYGAVVGFWGLGSLPRGAGLFPNEAYATATLRTILGAEARYFETFHSGYTTTLRQLCPPTRGNQPSLNSADLLDETRCGGGSDGTRRSFERAGYSFKYTPSGKQHFSLHADPIVRGKTGQRSFFVDESGVIRANAIQQATVKDSPI